MHASDAAGAGTPLPRPGTRIDASAHAQPTQTSRCRREERVPVGVNITGGWRRGQPDLRAGFWTLERIYG